jgi:hypothetical protein
MKIFFQSFLVSVVLSSLKAEKFSAIEELVTLTDNDEKLVFEVNRMIVKLEDMVVQLKR